MFRDARYALVVILTAVSLQAIGQAAGTCVDVPVADVTQGISGMKIGGTLSLCEQEAGDTVIFSASGTASITNVGDADAMAAVVSLLITFPHGESAPWIYSEDRLCGKPVYGQGKGVMNARVSLQPHSLPLHGALASPSVRASVSYVQFMDGTHAGSVDAAQRLLDSRARQLGALNGAVNAYGNQGEAGFVAFLKSNRNLIQFAQVEQQRGAAAALSAIQGQLATAVARNLGTPKP